MAANISNNPFLNPELMHPELAAQISEAETWQHMHPTEEQAIAVSSLTQVVELGVDQVPFPSITGEQRVFAEAIYDQRSISRLAYNTICEGLGAQKVSPEDFKQILIAKLETWSTDGSLEWANNHVNKYKGDMKLVAVPNIDISDGDVWDGVQHFSEGQPEYADHRQVVREGPAEHKATDYADTVSLNLFPTAGISTHPTHRPIEVVMKRIQDDGATSVEYPDLLETLCYWQTLRTDDEALADDFTNSRTEVVIPWSHGGPRLNVWYVSATRVVNTLVFANGTFRDVLVRPVAK